MAIVNEAGNYLKITEVITETGQIRFSLFESAEIRHRGPSTFERVVRETFTIGDLLDLELAKRPTPRKTIAENIMVAAYLALMNISAYADWRKA